jgi:hypothetical protein
VRYLHSGLVTVITLGIIVSSGFQAYYGYEVSHTFLHLHRKLTYFKKSHSSQKSTEVFMVTCLLLSAVYLAMTIYKAMHLTAKRKNIFVRTGTLNKKLIVVHIVLLLLQSTLIILY